ncbi:ribonuclease Z [uncultured Clostridium sp.]|jgi:ribonuclease Z|uniref:ribonuclease Z n=1 Tax=uncultured Clostridium sp. TaxID=59620 RepID=UPI00262F3D0C|nr:ribonuclease Z [uncultured Clostridium sp.]
MIDLAMLGIGGGMPLPGRYLSAGLLNFKGRKILIDCGEGTQVSMRELGWGFKSIDIICITHGHGDHTVGIPGLLATIGNSGRETPLTIIGPKGIKEIITGLRVIAPYLPYDINVIEASDSKFKFAIEDGELKLIDKNKTCFEPLEISTISVEHSAPCISYSFNIKRTAQFDIDKAIQNNVPKPLWGKLQKGGALEFEGITYTPALVLGQDRDGLKFSYVTDTRTIPKIVDFIKDSNLFVCEGTYGDDEDIDKAIQNKHMTFREAATLAKDANVEELLLTHFSPAMPNPSLFISNAREVFENTTIGEAHMIKKLIFK